MPHKRMKAGQDLGRFVRASWRDFVGLGGSRSLQPGRAWDPFQRGLGGAPGGLEAFPSSLLKAPPEKTVALVHVRDY